MAKTIEITCNTADTLSIDEMIPLQSHFKKRSKKDVKELAKSILGHGFVCPIFLWKSDKGCFIIDGAGRKEALEYLRSKKYEIPEVPVVYVEAENELEAKKKMLEVNNVNGVISKEELLAFADVIDLELGDIYIPGISFDEEKEEVTKTNDEVGYEEPDNTVACPNCGAKVRV